MFDKIIQTFLFEKIKLYMKYFYIQIYGNKQLLNIQLFTNHFVAFVINSQKINALFCWNKKTTLGQIAIK